MANQTHNQNERPELTPDRNVDAGVKDTFPASDPVAATASQGSRAVPAEKMMAPAGSKPPDGCVAVKARFRDREAAKLALESLVREGPVDPSHAEIQAGDDAVTLCVQAQPKDAGRLGELLRKQRGAEM
jgi:hypothetical protein